MYSSDYTNNVLSVIMAYGVVFGEGQHSLAPTITIVSGFRPLRVFLLSKNQITLEGSKISTHRGNL